MDRLWVPTAEFSIIQIVELADLSLYVEIENHAQTLVGGIMSAPRLQIANLDQENLDKLKAFEEEVGYYVVALQPQYELAKLSADDVNRLQKLEAEIGVVLLAYKGQD